MPRRHLLIELTGEVADQVQEYRREYDPVMADRIPPHVTLVYPQEADDEELLLDRVAEAAAATTPFDLGPGDVEKSNLGGVWFTVVDPSGTWSNLRRSILGPPFEPYPVTPHITVVHPRTSHRGPEALAAMNGTRVRGLCRVDEVVYAETGRRGTRVLERFPLSRQPSGG